MKYDEVDFYLIDLKSRFDKIKPNTYYLSYSGGKDSHFLYWFIKEYEDIINKAIEYIKEEFADLDFMKKEYKDLDKIYDTIIEINVVQVNKLMNILNGDDNE